jgi:hypothetical protein
MKNLTWNYVDKSTWPDGPWMQEPDKEQFTDPATGLPCLIRRNMMGCLSVYVGVAPGHLCYQVSPDEEPLAYISADRQICFADSCSGDEFGICHTVEPGEPDVVWWLGFDYGYAESLMPAEYDKKILDSMQPAMRERWMAKLPTLRYYDWSYAKAKAGELAGRLARLADPQALVGDVAAELAEYDRLIALLHQQDAQFTSEVLQLAAGPLYPDYIGKLRALHSFLTQKGYKSLV